jgi:hypothetical protein
VTRKLFEFHAKRLGFRGHEKVVDIEVKPEPAQRSLF